MAVLTPGAHLIKKVAAIKRIRAGHSPNGMTLKAIPENLEVTQIHQKKEDGKSLLPRTQVHPNPNSVTEKTGGMKPPVQKKGIPQEGDAIQNLIMILAVRGMNPLGPRKGIPQEGDAIQNLIMILAVRGMNPLGPRKGIPQEGDAIQNLIMILAVRGMNPLGPRKGIPQEGDAIQNLIMILAARGMNLLGPEKRYSSKGGTLFKIW